MNHTTVAIMSLYLKFTQHYYSTDWLNFRERPQGPYFEVYPGQGDGGCLIVLELHQEIFSVFLSKGEDSA